MRIYNNIKKTELKRPCFFAAIFFISLLCISLELFYTRILNLKTLNHIVYVIISWAILGYGIGSTIYIIFENIFTKLDKRAVISVSLLLLSFFGLICTILLAALPTGSVFTLLSAPIFSKSMLLQVINLGSIYTVAMFPFIIIGFLTVYIFSLPGVQTNRLYFFDLIGAGTGAFLFFVLINRMGVLRSLILLFSLAAILATIFILNRKKLLVAAATVLILCGIVQFLPEPFWYSIDMSKCWEYIPGYFDKSDYETFAAKWHALGYTTIYKFNTPEVRRKLYNTNIGTFEINLEPVPDFLYLCNDFGAGTPVYNLSPEGLKKFDSSQKTFSQPMEFPYLLARNPKVLIIGTGGGRDIFIAETHNAREIIGAEINPFTYFQMSDGGSLYGYSGKIYSRNNTRVFNCDGRHLVKKQKTDYFDLIILNGTDTYTGLSTGAYTFAEAYLYTKDAILDYLKIINCNGILNLNRWGGKESLRLFSISLDALRSSGIKEPWKHIIVGEHSGWGLMLIKKSSFTTAEENKIVDYLKNFAVTLIYAPSYKSSINSSWETFGRLPYNPPANAFKKLVDAFKSKEEKIFIKNYPFDISIITDESPFFYKTFKFRSINLRDIKNTPTPFLIQFLTQCLILIQCCFFILLFIFLPLYILKRRGLSSLNKAFPPFIIFFACLGIGFIFIEIILMQKFVLLLGGPIYSIAVTLSALLISSGLGSLSLPSVKRLAGSSTRLIHGLSIFIVIYIFLLVYFGVKISNFLIVFTFPIRIAAVVLIVFPPGFCMGMFFPSGLALIKGTHPLSIGWAWGINIGFTVIGSILSIILAQVMGFNIVLMIAGFFYIVASLSFAQIAKKLDNICLADLN